MRDLAAAAADGHIPAAGPVEGAAAEGPALKPRERSSTGAATRPAAAEEEVAAQSAKAPESDINLLVVATTEAIFDISQKPQYQIYRSLSLSFSLSIDMYTGVYIDIYVMRCCVVFQL